VEIADSNKIVPKYIVDITYLVSVTFLLKGSNLTTIFFTGFKFTSLSCFAIALEIPADLFRVPENLTDIFLRTLCCQLRTLKFHYSTTLSFFYFHGFEEQTTFFAGNVLLYIEGEIVMILLWKYSYFLAIFSLQNFTLSILLGTREPMRNRLTAKYFLTSCAPC
jgi:hypothetical protein